MNDVKTVRRARKGAALIAFVLAAALPLAAFAETATGGAADASAAATMPVQRGGAGTFGNGNAERNADTSAMTDEQKTIYEQAVSLYEGVEDAVLGDLVAGNIVTQADADAYKALREAEKSLNDLDQSAWTAEQYKAYYEANAKTGDERKEAMRALADSGLITQAQADALAAQGQDDLWATVSRNADTNTAIQTALNTLQQARRTMQETLRSAGITTGTGNGNGLGGANPGMGGRPGVSNGNGGDNGNRTPGGAKNNPGVQPGN